MRHGRSLADDENKIEGKYDSPLTDIGINQARKTICRFSDYGYKFKTIFCSTLQRSYKTAEIINEFYNVEIVKSELLNERDNGILAGLEKRKANLQFPLNNDRTPFCYFPKKSGENLILLQSRALQALDLISRYDEGEYLIVSHGGTLNALLRVIMNIPNPTLGSGVVFEFKDNGFIEIDFHKDKYKWSIKRFEN